MVRMQGVALFFSVFIGLQAVGQTGPCACPPAANRPVRYISDNAGAGTGTATWTCDTTYVLTGPVFVNAGHTLTIEPGTVVKMGGTIGAVT